jgi:hypothetical protein
MRKIRQQFYFDGKQLNIEKLKQVRIIIPYYPGPIRSSTAINSSRILPRVMLCPSLFELRKPGY